MNDGGNRIVGHASKAKNASAGATCVARRDALRSACARQRSRRARVARATKRGAIAHASRGRSAHVERAVSEVVALARRGYIEQRDGDRYTLTLKLFELAHRHKPIQSPRCGGAPLMLDLVRARCMCHLTVFYAGRYGRW